MNIRPNIYAFTDVERSKRVMRLYIRCEKALESPDVTPSRVDTLFSRLDKLEADRGFPKSPFTNRIVEGVRMRANCYIHMAREYAKCN